MRGQMTFRPIPLYVVAWESDIYNSPDQWIGLFSAENFLDWSLEA